MNFAASGAGGSGAGAGGVSRTSSGKASARGTGPGLHTSGSGNAIGDTYYQANYGREGVFESDDDDFNYADHGTSYVGRHQRLQNIRMQTSHSSSEEASASAAAGGGGGGFFRGSLYRSAMQSRERELGAQSAAVSFGAALIDGDAGENNDNDDDNDDEYNEDYNVGEGNVEISPHGSNDKLFVRISPRGQQQQQFFHDDSNSSLRRVQLWIMNTTERCIWSLYVFSLIMLDCFRSLARGAETVVNCDCLETDEDSCPTQPVLLKQFLYCLWRAFVVRYR
jgi:hypothetical protein